MKRWLAVSVLSLICVGLIHDGVWARPPLFVIETIPDQTIQATKTLQYQVRYRVEDEVCWMGRISFALAGAPSGMTITAGGRITWTPDATQAEEIYQVTVRATALTPDGPPCWGSLGQDSESFTIAVLAAPPSEPPTSAVNVELTESAMNNALASLVEVRGINFGQYLAGFIDAWWMNIDSASIDVLVPSANANRARITATATAKAVLDLLVISLPASANANGWIEGDIYLAGSPDTGYKVMFHPTNLDLDAWINGVPGWLSGIIIGIATGGLGEIPDLELNLGTQITPLFACVPPNLTTNPNQTALVLEWDVTNLNCASRSKVAPTTVALARRTSS